MFLTSSFVTYFFFKKEFKFTRIIEMVFFENEAKLILTNRLGMKYKRITVNKSDFNVRILNESFQEIVGIQVESKNKAIGDFNFLNINRIDKKEQSLLDFLKNYKKTI